MRIRERTADLLMGLLQQRLAALGAGIAADGHFIFRLSRTRLSRGHDVAEMAARWFVGIIYTVHYAERPHIFRVGYNQLNILNLLRLSLSWHDPGFDLAKHLLKFLKLKAGWLKNCFNFQGVQDE